MGRKKIRIEPIKGDRNRSATYLKRKHGLFKKAHELAVLTDSEIAVIVFGNNGKVAEFCSGNMDEVLVRYTEYNGTIERRRPEHYAKDSFESDVPLQEPITGLSNSSKLESAHDMIQPAAQPQLSNQGQVQDITTHQPAALQNLSVEGPTQGASFKSIQVHTASGMQDSVAESFPESIPSDLAQAKHTALRMARNWDGSQIHQIESNALAPTPLEMEPEDNVRTAQVASPHKLPSLARAPSSTDLRKSAPGSFPTQASSHAERSAHLRPPPIPARLTRSPDLGLEYNQSSNGPNPFMQPSTGYALPMDINYLHATMALSNSPTPNPSVSPRPPDLLLPPQQLSSSQHRIDVQGPLKSPLTPNSAHIYSPCGHSPGLDVSPLSTPAVSDSPLSPLPANIPSLATPDPNITAPPSTDLPTERRLIHHHTSTNNQATPYPIIFTPHTPNLAMNRDTSEIHDQKP